jgi:protein-tyrosine phosphatase
MVAVPSGRIPVSPNWIQLEGAHNARDLGSMPAELGTTRTGVLLRSDALDQLTPGDVEILHGSWGLAHVVDLRSGTERGDRGRGLLDGSGVRYTELEVIGPDDLERRQQNRKSAFSAGDPPHVIMADGYAELLELGAAAFVEAFDRIVAPGGTPVLIHCAAGKDRTGVLVALLLDAVGVERDVIIADYAATNERMAPIVARLAGAAIYEQSTEDYPAFVYEAVGETMARFHEHLEQRWGGGIGFFTAHGIGHEAIDRWRDVFVAT